MKERSQEANKTKQKTNGGQTYLRATSHCETGNPVWLANFIACSLKM